MLDLCVGCGAVFETRTERGRSRQYCSRCSPPLPRGFRRNLRIRLLLSEFPLDLEAEWCWRVGPLVCCRVKDGAFLIWPGWLVATWAMRGRRLAWWPNGVRVGSRILKHP